MDKKHSQNVLQKVSDSYYFKMFENISESPQIYIYAMSNLPCCTFPKSMMKTVKLVHMAVVINRQHNIGLNQTGQHSRLCVSRSFDSSGWHWGLSPPSCDFVFMFPLPFLYISFSFNISFILQYAKISTAWLVKELVWYTRDSPAQMSQSLLQYLGANAIYSLMIT